MLFMVIEHFKDGDPEPVYRRFDERGRLAPDGLDYLGSWVTADLTRCYQVMETDDRSLLEEWMGRWADLVRFDVIEVITSAEAAAEVARR
jgi:hypothetical protein